jgi:hypothetical protein
VRMLALCCADLAHALRDLARPHSPPARVLCMMQHSIASSARWRGLDDVMQVRRGGVSWCALAKVKVFAGAHHRRSDMAAAC